MNKVLALVVAAAMGLSSAAFAAETSNMPKAPAATGTHVEQANTTHHKKHKKEMKHETSQPAAQKAQAAKKHHKKQTHEATKPAAKPAA